LTRRGSKSINTLIGRPMDAFVLTSDLRSLTIRWVGVSRIVPCGADHDDWCGRRDRLGALDPKLLTKPMRDGAVSEVRPSHPDRTSRTASDRRGAR
jgi:hypothetical protein